MSKWGKKIELSEAELRVIINLAGRALFNQIQCAHIDPVLANLVKKTAKVLAPKGEMTGTGPRDLVIGGQVVAKVDNIPVEVGEGALEDLAALHKEPVILLIKPAPAQVEEVKQ